MKMEANIKARQLLIIAVLLLLFSNSFSQPFNLVNNSSFEDTLNCNILPPATIADKWTMIYGSPDYFNNIMTTCSFANNGFNNFWADGVQSARTENSYMGFGFCKASICGTMDREAIQTQLINTLVSGKKYCVSFYINLANKAQYSSDDVGFYLSTISSIPFPAPAQFYSEQGFLLNDTANWMLIKSIFVSSGNELYLNIGNFKNDANTTMVLNNPGSSTFVVYYFIDDVSVYELPEIDAGSNNTINVGGNIQLNANCTGCWSGLQYRWFPSVGLNDTTILNPLASPTQTTTYYFGLVDTSGTIPCMTDYIDSVTITVTGIEDIDFVNQISVFPNPNEGNFEINFSKSKKYSIEIINNLGVCVYTEKVSASKYNINTTFDTGLYILKITDIESKKYTHKKIIITK